MNPSVFVAPEPAHDLRGLESKEGTASTKVDSRLLRRFLLWLAIAVAIPAIIMGLWSCFDRGSHVQPPAAGAWLAPYTDAVVLMIQLLVVGQLLHVVVGLIVFRGCRLALLLLGIILIIVTTAFAFVGGMAVTGYWL